MKHAFIFLMAFAAAEDAKKPAVKPPASPHGAGHQ